MKRVGVCKRAREGEKGRERLSERKRGREREKRGRWRKQNGLAVPQVTTATRRCEKRLLSKYNTRLLNYYSTIIKINPEKSEKYSENYR